MNLNNARKHFPLIIEQAHRNFDNIITEHPGMIEVVENAAVELVDIKMARVSKLIILRKIIDKFNDIIYSYTACSKGCSSCCYMATLTFSIEVEEIGIRVGKKPKPFKGIFKNIDDATLTKVQDEIQGIPCTFLKDNQCSIYDIRPLACRLHHNLSEVSFMCDTSLKSEDTCIPKIDFPQFTFAMVVMLSGDGNKMGDIREAFPTSAKSIYQIGDNHVNNKM
jgi:Fe-S-cluster containining protein